MTAQYPAYRAPVPNRYPHPYPPSTDDVNAPSAIPKDIPLRREISRTPSPTPSEERELEYGAFDFRGWKSWRFWVRKEWIWYYVIFILVAAFVGVIVGLHTKIIHALTPATNWMHNLPYGYLIPVAVLIIISFPPLFGHEIVAGLCGIVWGLWLGFAIVCVGTLVGEIGTYYAFKYCCRARVAKQEKARIWYGCLAKVIRDGGFKIVVIARLSAIPPHFSTAVFSTCGVGIVTFCIAAILGLPKQFATVYLGVILDGPSSGSNVKYAVISGFIIITIGAMLFIFWKMGRVKPAVIYERRKARQGKAGAEITPYFSPTFASATNLTVKLSDVEKGITRPAGGTSSAMAYGIPMVNVYPAGQTGDDLLDRSGSARKHSHSDVSL